jgi:hypothetical protein
VDLHAAALALYGLTPDEFTSARNELAKATKGAGEAAAIKALRKPTLAAWLANLLVRTDPDEVNDLTELGDELRTAHLSADGARLRQLTPRRHDLVQHLVRTAQARAMERGRPISATVVGRLTETLDAALIDPGAAQLLRSGRLTSALRHVGFGVVDESGEPAEFPPMKPRTVRSASTKAPAKTPAKRPGRLQRTTGDRALERRRSELRTQTEEAETEYAEAEAERIEAESLLDANQHQIADLQTTIDRLTEELDRARQQLKDAERQTVRLHRGFERASRTAGIAQRRRDSQQERLANLDG